MSNLVCLFCTDQTKSISAATASITILLLQSSQKKISTQKVKEPLSFETWIFRNDRPDYDDDRRIFVAMNSS